MQGDFFVYVLNIYERIQIIPTHVCMVWYLEFALLYLHLQGKSDVSLALAILHCLLCIL